MIKKMNLMEISPKSRFKNVKYILNSNGQWYENTDHYEPLKFSF